MDSLHPASQEDLQGMLEQILDTVKPKIQYFPSIFAATEPLMQASNDGKLIPTALDTLSPQHSAVFLFGCQVMQLLANCALFPSVPLLLAKSIPASPESSNEALTALGSRDFHFDATNQILYLSEAKLQHVGHFVAAILQSMAHIASGNRTDGTREGVLRPNLLS